MTDAHAHIELPGCVCILAEPCAGKPKFVGWHPWHLEGLDLDSLRNRLAADKTLGVGEIGLDRLKSRDISAAMRNAFESQLAIAAEFARPVVLHGAKCWGEVVKACIPHKGRIPAFLFHGFSRSAGLIGDIVALNGFISVGPAILNDHAVNYRAMAKSMPAEILLAETDAKEPSGSSDIAAVVAKLADIRGVAQEEMESVIDANAKRFMESIS
ncbi:MAG: TatD family hydrolase [Kiritimatiellae bacterium]|nr:TatD family hydrolase [Kiritimatiellia bacterium]